MAHKMYGFPYLDISGVYGISARDNYIILQSDYSLAELKELAHFLSTKFAIFIFQCTNYRMRYLEKYAFQFLPVITKITNFPRLTKRVGFLLCLRLNRKSADVTMEPLVGPQSLKQMK